MIDFELLGRILEEPVRRTALVALVAIAAAASSAAALAGAIDLRITYRPMGSATATVLTLHCGPARGSVSHPGTACRRLIAIGPRAFAPTPRGMQACSQIYGGPQTAIVTGTYFGRPVWVKLSRVDGCAIARWQKVGFLFPSSAS